MAKFILRSEKQIGTVKMDGDYTAERALQIMQNNEPDANWTECEKVPRGKHTCKYCGQIAEGTFQDLLCGTCRETFGHSLFSEL
jgi:rubrerythrin